MFLSSRLYNAGAGVIAAAFVVLLSAGCSMPHATSEKADIAACNAHDPADLTRFPQTIGPYLVNVREHGLLSPLQRAYGHAYYKVWDPAYVPDEPATVKWPFTTYTEADAYGENLRPLPPKWFSAMMTEADWPKYNTVAKPALSLKRLDLRNFPTAKPLFRNPCEAGEGFPFDYLQNSTVFANEPLYLSHYSQSGAWAYVLTSYASGWVPADAIAIVDDSQVKAWQAAPLLALLGDNMPLRTEKGDYLFEGQTGMMLPMRAHDQNGFSADAAIARGVRSARLIPLPIAETAAATVPMRFTRANLERVITPMQQTKYGWGGLYGDRDCSSTLRDLFAPFGFWLPRNSYQQAAIGRVVSFEGLDDEAKLAKIVREARPFETLLYMKGHIMLYLGLYHGEPAVLHTFWGIKTVEEGGNDGRYIVGKTVISSLRLGRELPTYREENSLLHKLESMNFLFEEASQ